MRRQGGGRDEQGKRWTSLFCFGSVFFPTLAWAGAGEVTGVMNEAKNIRCVGVAEEGAGERCWRRFR